MELYNKIMKEKKYFLCSDKGNTYYTKEGVISVSDEEDIKYFKERNFVELKEDKKLKQDERRGDK